MSYLVLSYPVLSPGDHAWIQSVRAEHDTQYEIVGPHFTFVFPVSVPDQEAFMALVQSEARNQARFSFALRCAAVVKDALSTYTHVCLAPDEGYSTMVKLHDRLYSGPLAAELRLDNPFIPYMTVGNNTDAQVCKRLADELNARSFVVLGEITMLDVVRYEEGRLESLERIELANNAESEKSES
jgi:hypothetical protein